MGVSLFGDISCGGVVTWDGGRNVVQAGIVEGPEGGWWRGRDGGEEGIGGVGEEEAGVGVWEGCRCVDYAWNLWEVVSMNRRYEREEV